MTNTEMIMSESVELMKQGILDGTMETVTDENGEEVELKIPEEIHTFDGWKKLGLIVKKGEHGIAKFPIWSPTKTSLKKIAEAKKNGEELPEMQLYMRMATWFKREQVQTIEEAEKAREAEKRAKAEKPAEPARDEKPKAVEKPKKQAKPKKSAKPRAKKAENPYKPFIAEMHKATLKKNKGTLRLIYRREGNTVYITNGYLALKVSLNKYNECFVKAKDYYKPLNDGDGCLVQGGEIIEGQKLALGELFKQEAEKATEKCEVTKYAEKTEKGIDMRAVKCGSNNVVIAVNDDYLKALPNRKWKGSDMIHAIVSKDAIILPIRHDLEFDRRMNEALA